MQLKMAITALNTISPKPLKCLGKYMPRMTISKMIQNKLITNPIDTGSELKGWLKLHIKHPRKNRLVKRYPLNNQISLWICIKNTYSWTPGHTGKGRQYKMCKEDNLELLPGYIWHFHLHIHCSCHLSLGYDWLKYQLLIWLLYVIFVVKYSVTKTMCCLT